MFRVEILRGLAMLLFDVGSFKRIFIKKTFLAMLWRLWGVGSPTRD